MDQPFSQADRPELTLRLMRAADIPFANRLRRRAGWNQSERDWHGYLAYEPEGCFVAEVAGEPAGTATTICYGDRFGWIGMVLVDPDRRRLGIGTRLLNQAIAYLQQRGVRGIKLDATPMGKKVYGPMGFVDEYELARYEGTAPAMTERGGGNSPALERQRVSDDVGPLAPADFAEIARLDAVGFGAGRERVLRSLGGRNPELCLVARSRDGIAGYLIAREGATVVQVGPWVAREAAVAERLLLAFFAVAGGRRVFIDGVASNAAAGEMVRRHGFTVQRTLTRMFLGENAHPGEPRLIFGVSSPEKG